MAAYSARHYGRRRWRLRHPRVIVLHFTAGPSYRSAWETFASNAPSLGELPGVCSHFVIEKRGRIHRLVRPAIRCRHTIGLNHRSIGVEMVQEAGRGSHWADRQILHRRRQIHAALHLVGWLKQRFGIRMRDIIGHAMADRSPYFKDLEGWRNDHTDWLRRDVRKFRHRLREAAQAVDRAPVARSTRSPGGILEPMPAPLIEFPADDPDRARRFWTACWAPRSRRRPAEAGSGWEIEDDGLRLGVHERGPGPGDTASLPYFTVADLEATLERVRELGGSVIHPGERWAVCRDSEGSPFALAAAPRLRGSAYLAREREAPRDVVRRVVRLAVVRPASARWRFGAAGRLAVERPAARLAVERPAALRRVPVRVDAFVGEERARRFCSRSMSRSRALLSLPLSRRASLTNF